ncbi:PTS glucose transporter subunit IIA [Enterococcus sp. BWB1-3]|uniref:PTS sugar transporter subunit IIA n=1 Tax=unclassified Enterococcus TaxID=2608891 RepID=UPI001921F052|nr:MULTISPECIES: PTS glucose transporter subunit IIA [unclassified Enterococcus]MBL1230003.1 PTS glucose transporter subunit IIA [Enterococcus sp. BWB1-3]MCB5952466.1 PTS glucose transporter subunit IIA [Enterococcus sp. BWT-B8]MCB5953504.1 PTS glucose transporter subunit IIA [Enterococcus sp. CWB-B31]
MGLFSRKQTLNAVAAGELIPISKVKDEVFASGMMGNGFAIVNHDGKVFAPCNGTITNIFPTKHAITLTGNRGEVILIHMGIDTVDLKGYPFKLVISNEQRVQKGDLIAEINLSLLKDRGKDDTLIVVTPDRQQGEIKNSRKFVTPHDPVFTL